MTETVKYSITYSQFAALLKLGDNDADYDKLHDSEVLELQDLSFMYPRAERGNVGKVHGLYPYYSVLYRLFRKTLTPRDGNTSDITLYQRNLMAAMKPGARPFSVGDFIWQEIKGVSENTQKICSFSPFIMYMIKRVTTIRFPSDTEHRPLRPKSSFAIRFPSPPSEPEIIEEQGGHPQPPLQQFEQPYGQEQPAASADGTGGLTACTSHHRRDPVLQSRSGSNTSKGSARHRETSKWCKEKI